MLRNDIAIMRARSTTDRLVQIANRAHTLQRCRAIYERLTYSVLPCSPCSREPKCPTQCEQRGVGLLLRLLCTLVRPTVH